MLYLLPQLAVKNRYTEDWSDIWVRELNKLDIQFVVWGKYQEPVGITKFFTDPKKALIYECNQIEDLAKCAKGRVLCLDIDFPGLLVTAIPVLKLQNPGMKFYGYLHAGSWCNGDIFSGQKEKYWLERACFDAFSKIFVASFYHKRKIESYFGEHFDNLEVVGFPFYKKDVYDYTKPIPFEKKNNIVICGRKEQSNLENVERLQKSFPEENIFLLEANDRKTYYDYLNQAKIVISLKTEETFGITPLETYILGGIPLCPNRFAYPEVIGDARLLYSEQNLLDRLEELIQLKSNSFRIEIEKYENTIFKCMESMNAGE